MPLIPFSSAYLGLPGVRVIGSRMVVPNQLRGPTLARKAANLAGALTQAAVGAIQGRPILATESTRTARMAACLGCELWEPGGNLMMGECQHPRCGCTRAKWKLAAATCPLRRWPPPTDPPPPTG